MNFWECASFLRSGWICGAPDLELMRVPVPIFGKFSRLPRSRKSVSPFRTILVHRKLLRINTCRSVYSEPFRMNTYKKTWVGGTYFLIRISSAGARRLSSRREKT